MKNSFKTYESIAIDACKAGGEILLGYFNKITEYENKENAGIVTKADKECEELIVNYLTDKTPGFSILAEEKGLTEKGENKWIIDPLDGTCNYFHGFPHYNISIGLEIEGNIVVGVIYNPCTGEIYHCYKGSGAYINNKKIEVSKTNKVLNSMIGTGFAYQRGEKLEYSLNLFRQFTLNSHGLRRPGAAALDLAYVARGIYEGFYELTLSPWDVAAGILLVNEAGGTVSSFDGSEFSVYSGEIVASNSFIHSEMLELIKSVHA